MSVADVVFCEAIDRRSGTVGASVVYEQALVIIAWHEIESGRDLIEERGDVVLLVIEWNDYRDAFVIPSSGSRPTGPLVKTASPSVANMQVMYLRESRLMANQKNISASASHSARSVSVDTTFAATRVNGEVA